MIGLKFLVLCDCWTQTLYGDVESAQINSMKDRTHNGMKIRVSVLLTLYSLQGYIRPLAPD